MASLPARLDTAHSHEVPAIPIVRCSRRRTEQAGLADAAPAKPTAPFTPDTSRRSPAVIPAARLPHDELNKKPAL